MTVLLMNMRLSSNFPPGAISGPHWMISVFIFGFRFYDDHPRTQITERQGPGMYYTRWEYVGGDKGGNVS